jgi:hypothetical protein
VLEPEGELTVAVITGVVPVTTAALTVFEPMPTCCSVVESV